MVDNIKKANQYMFLAVIVLLSACVSQPSRPTLDPNIIETIAAKTVQAQLEVTVRAASPTATPPLPTPAPTSTMTTVPSPTITATPRPPLILTPGTTPVTIAIPTEFSTSESVPPPSGDIGMPLDHDPINGTTMQKNQEFDMTWTVKNAGNTTWNKGYYITFFGGDRIGKGDNVYFLTRTINPGEVGSITVKMAAPDRTGTYESIWMLMNDQQKPFMELNVVIVVP